MCGGNCGGSSGHQFFQTRMGQKFFSRDLPKLTNQLEAQNLLKLAELTEDEGEKEDLKKRAKERMGLK